MIGRAQKDKNFNSLSNVFILRPIEFIFKILFIVLMKYKFYVKNFDEKVSLSNKKVIQGIKELKLNLLCIKYDKEGFLVFMNLEIY